MPATEVKSPKVSDEALKLIHLSRRLIAKICPSSKYVIHFEENEEAAKLNLELISVFLSDIACLARIPNRWNYMAYIFYPDPEYERENGGIKSYYQQVYASKKEASALLKKLSLADFDEEYNALLSAAEQKLRHPQCWRMDSQTENPFFMLLACEFLLMTYADLHYTSAFSFLSDYEPTDQGAFLKKRAVPLYKMIILALEQYPNTPGQEEQLKLYKQIRDSFKTCPLETTPAPVLMNPQAPSSSKLQPEKAPTPQAEKSGSTFECNGPR